MARRTYRVNADSWTKLVDLLVATPEEFNPDMTKRYVGAGQSYDGYRYSNVLRGRTMNVGRRSQLGQLPDEWRAQWHNADVDYVIYSYDTPIAWRQRETWYGNGGQTHTHKWIVPDVTYSRTTSKHQAKVRTALSQISGGI